MLQGRFKQKQKILDETEILVKKTFSYFIKSLFSGEVEAAVSLTVDGRSAGLFYKHLRTVRANCSIKNLLCVSRWSYL
jgi:hypothetical protein